MDKVNQKMKKFNLRGVLDGIRSSVSTSPKPELTIEESLRSDHFQLAKTVCHGFPYQPTAMAYDAVQNILAIGTKCGRVRIFGRPGVDCQINHNEGCAIIQILFLVNEGALLTIGDNDTVYLWTLRQKYPEIVHSLKFQRERITCCHLPFQSKWLYIGSKNGNVHIINIECFTLSGYIINWNKAIELTRKTHPGSVVHLSDCPVDPSKLLIGFESGAVVLWDLKNRTADSRYNCTEPVRSICWHHEGKQFMCSHTDGSLTVWMVRCPQKPQNIVMPHAKLGKDGKPEPCRSITKVEWKSVRNSEPYIIFSGGMPVDRVDRSPSITVMHVKSTTVLEMEHDIVDFITLCSTPWKHDFQDPTAIVVLLTNDLVVVDLTSPGYPCFENPYPMDIHESPVTACNYIADCPTDLIPAFYSVGSKQKKSGYSEKDWPVKGGEWGTPTCSYPELIITGHADGSVKFWDASAVTLQVLYKLKSAKLFDKSKCCQPDSDDDPFAIQLMHLCAESRLFCIAGLSHVILFRFSKQEATIECPCLDVSIIYEIYDELDSPSVEYPPIPPKPSIGSTSQSGSIGSYSSLTSDGKEKQTSVTLKNGSRKWSMGYQPDLCVLLNWIDGEPAPPVASISLNSSYGLLAFGNECGIAIIDIVQKTCLLNMGTPDLYGSMDPYSRAPRSPKNKSLSRPQGLEGLSQNFNMDDTKSPTQEQRHHVYDGHLRISNKSDGSFSRSRSSSMSSLENVSKESIQCLTFADAFTRKTDTYTYPCLWVGTVLGSVLVISINLPDESDRKTQPVIVSPSGTIFRLKGSILAMSFLDCNGFLIPAVAEQWRDCTREDRDSKRTYNRQQSVSSLKSRMSPTSSQDITVQDRQLAILCSEKQARVISLPSQTCAYKVKITETSVVAKADVIGIKDSVCLGCYVANGHVMIFSLPSLKPLLDVHHVPMADVRVAKTFCFSNNGHALYFCSPTEVQKITFSAKICENLKEMLGDLFLPTEPPDAPKQNFLKSLFTGGPATLDREELFGEGSGKASKGVVKYTAGMGQMQEKMGIATSEIGRAKMAAIERGQHLSELEEASARMRNEAESYSQHAHQLMQKYRDKKWYQF